MHPFRPYLDPYHCHKHVYDPDSHHWIDIIFMNKAISENSSPSRNSSITTCACFSECFETSSHNLKSNASSCFRNNNTFSGCETICFNNNWCTFFLDIFLALSYISECFVFAVGISYFFIISFAKLLLPSRVPLPLSVQNC